MRGQVANVLTVPSDSAAQHMTNEFLTFRSSSKEYGIESLKVQKIRRYDSDKQIENAADFVKDDVNLLGSTVPIVDMRIKFKLDYMD